MCKNYENATGLDYDEVYTEEFLAGKRCKKCGNEVYVEADEGMRRSYPYFCKCCDENMFSFEVENIPDVKRPFKVYKVNYEIKGYFYVAAENKENAKDIFDNTDIIDMLEDNLKEDATTVDATEIAEL